VLLGRSNGSRHYTHTQGILPGTGLHYDFSYERVQVAADKPRVVHVASLGITLTTPPAYSVVEKKELHTTVAAISTDLDLVEGQKTVVGKSSINNAGDALILVIVPKVVE
jgi:hypothetical protein